MAKTVVTLAARKVATGLLESNNRLLPYWWVYDLVRN